MATWQFDQFSKYVQKEIAPNYLFYGEELYLTDQALNILKSKVFESGLADFNYDVFYGEDVEMDRLQEAIETLPMMAEKRLVVLKGAHLLSTSNLEKLSEIISIPIDSTCFIAIFNSIDQRKKIFKDLLKKMTVVELDLVSDKLIPMWTHKIAESLGKKVAPQAAKTLYELIGNRLMDLSNELNKLACYVGDRIQIELADVEAVVSKYKLDSVFELTDAIGHKNFERAFEIQKYLVDQGESEVGILAMMTRHFRILTLIHEAQGLKVPAAHIASYAGVPPFFVNNYLLQAKVWRPEQLKRSYAKLVETDRFFKSAKLNSSHFLFDALSSITLS